MSALLAVVRTARGYPLALLAAALVVGGGAAIGVDPPFARPTGAEDPPCATPSSQEVWHGLALRADETGHPDDVLAAVTWRRVQTSNCVDRYEPNGSVRARFAVPRAACVQSISPQTHPVGAVDGILEIDRNTNPPTYQGSGHTAWTLTWNCEYPNGEIVSLEVQVGGTWFEAFGGVDDERVAGHERRQPPRCGLGTSTYCEYLWGFDPGPDDELSRAAW